MNIDSHLLRNEPVTAQAAGQPLHTRLLDIELRCVAEGTLAARAILHDLRKGGFIPMVDDLQTAGVIHDMRIQAKVDATSRELLAIDSQQASVVFEPSEFTGGESCRDPAGNLQNIVGQRYDEGMRKRLGDAMGGPRGCSHLLTLAHTLAQVVPRALDAGLEIERREPGERLYKRALYVDGFEPAEGKLQLAVQQHDFLFAPAVDERSGVKRLGRHDQVCALATVDMATRAVEALGASDRSRNADTLDQPAWRDRSPELAFAIGSVIVPGLGGQLIRTLGGRDDASLMLEALLHFSPGFIQCPAALADRYLAQAGAGVGPGYSSGSGGASNSCYIWRDDGALLSERAKMAAQVGAGSSPPDGERSS